MGCTTSILQDIINTCKPVKGLYPRAFVAPIQEVVFTFLDDTSVNPNNLISGVVFSGDEFAIWESTKFAFNAGSEVVTSDVRETEFKQKFSAVFAKGSQGLDEADGLVFIVETPKNVFLAYGATNGLWKTTQAKMANDNQAMISAEYASREGMQEKFSEWELTKGSVINGMDYFGFSYAELVDKWSIFTVATFADLLLANQQPGQTYIVTNDETNGGNTYIYDLDINLIYTIQEITIII